MPPSTLWHMNAEHYTAVSECSAMGINTVYEEDPELTGLRSALRMAFTQFKSDMATQNEEIQAESLWRLRFAWADFCDWVEDYDAQAKSLKDGTPIPKYWTYDKDGKMIWLTKCQNNRRFEQTCKDVEEEAEEYQDEDAEYEQMRQEIDDYGRWMAGELDDNGYEVLDV